MEGGGSEGGGGGSPIFNMPQNISRFPIDILIQGNKQLKYRYSVTALKYFLITSQEGL